MTAKELIYKYLGQGLTNDERFNLEKKALDDEFLDTAWEGYQLHQKGDKHEVIPTLENRLAQATKQKTKGRVVSFRKYWPMVAAASVALLFGANFLFNSPSSEAPNDGAMAVVLEEEVEGENVSDLQDEAFVGVAKSNIPEAQIAREIIAKKAIEKTVSHPIPSSKSPTRTDEITITESAELIAFDDGIGESSAIIGGGNNQGRNTITANESILPSTASLDKEEQGAATIEIPASDAEIVIALNDGDESKAGFRSLSKKVGEETNAEGQTEKPQSASINNKSKLLGKRLNLDSNTSVLSINDTQKAPNFSKRIKFNSETPDIAKASPSMGWTAFQKYIDDNTRFDKDELFMRSLKAEEIIIVPLVFDLDEFNKPTDVKVRKEQWGNAIEGEVIRVLKGSGTWSTLQPGTPISFDLKVKLRTKE